MAFSIKIFGRNFGIFDEHFENIFVSKLSNFFLHEKIIFFCRDFFFYQCMDRYLHSQTSMGVSYPLSITFFDVNLAIFSKKHEFSLILIVNDSFSLIKERNAYIHFEQWISGQFYPRAMADVPKLRTTGGL